MKEIISFGICGTEFAFEIEYMQSLEKYHPVVPVPEAPDYILGAVNIRGEIFPVYNINERFGMPDSEITENTKILILKAGELRFACLIDSVQNVVRADGIDVQDFPNVARTEGTQYVDFIVRKDGNLVLALNPAKLMSEAQMEEVSSLDLQQREE